jgi:short-subunit dehydrogenase
VVGLARRRDRLIEVEGLLRAVSPESSTRFCDVGDGEALQSVLGEVEEECGRIDMVFNNAGIELLTPWEDGYSPAYRQLFDVNFFGVVAATLAVLPGMVRRQSGIVVNVCSDSARAPEPRHGAYAASKAAVGAFTEAIAHEVLHHGVHLHAFYPAWVPTAIGMSWVGDGGSLPPRLVRRSESRVSALVLSRMGGRRIEINATSLPLLALVGRCVTPISYQRAMRRYARGMPEPG